MALLVPEVGVEPTLPEGNGILSPARLPVSPLRPKDDYSPQRIADPSSLIANP